MARLPYNIWDLNFFFIGTALICASLWGLIWMFVEMFR